MIQHKSVEKRARQNEKHKIKNNSIKSALKKYIKKTLINISNKCKKNEIENLLKKTISNIDKAVNKGVLHKKNGSRKVARLTKKVNHYLK